MAHGLMIEDLYPVAARTKYPLEAFVFVQKGLERTTRAIHGPSSPEEFEADDLAGIDAEPSTPKKVKNRHIGGRELAMGLRDFAIEQYGLMARTVLRHWQIHRTDDFGHIVFAMVDSGLLRKQPEDSVEDFFNVFDFSEAFDGRFTLRPGPLPIEPRRKRSPAA